MHPRCPCRSQQVRQTDQVWYPPLRIASLACVCVMAACPLLFLKPCQTVTLCYQRFTHTATPHSESSACIVRPALSRKNVKANELATMHEFGFQGVVLRFFCQGDSDMAAEPCDSVAVGSVVVDAWLHILSAARRLFIH